MSRSVGASEDEESTRPGRSEQAYSLGRVLSISDGVFAFALTLLVVSLAVPVGSDQDSLTTQLLAQQPSYRSYALSFAVIALTWYTHHQIFRYVLRTDATLIALNFLALLVVAVLPFPTAVLGHNVTDPVAAVLYAVTIAMSGVFSAVIWWYATHRRRLVRANLPDRTVKVRMYRTVSVPVLFFASIPIAVWSPLAAQVGWIVIWLGYVVSLQLPWSWLNPD